MANYSNLKAAVAAAIKTNGNQEITGQVLQDVLTSIISVIGANYTFAGVATPSTNPSTPDQNVFYFATEAGTYSNFGGISITERSLFLFLWNGTWTNIDLLNLDEYYQDLDTLVAQFEQQLRQMLEDYQPIVIEGNVTNAPDEEDLTSVDGLLRFKNRNTLYGKGCIYLRRELGFAEQLTQENTTYVIRYEYTLTEDVIIPANCVLVFEGGSLKSSNNNTVSGTSLSIYGNGAKINNVRISVVGNNNIIKDFIIFRETKSSTDHVLYSTTGLAVSGDNNIIDTVESYNQNGFGIYISGRNNKLNNIYCHDNITGLYCANSTRNINITNSRFVNNDVNNGSGADGILFHRSVIGVILDNCDLSYNGEHGIYFQGQNATITNNRVFGNHGSGLKFGCYEDGNYEYAGETIDKWVPGYEGIPGYDDVVGANGFGMKNIVISNNIIGAQASTGSAIYFQPSVKGLLISDNIIYDTDVRIVFFNYGTRLEVIKDITVCNNKVENGNIACQVNENCLIKGNTVVNGGISTFCANSTTPPYMNTYANNCIVSNNIADRIGTERTRGCIVSKNSVKEIGTNTNIQNLTIDGNVVTEQTSYRGSVISVFKNNTITMKDDNSFFVTEGYFYAKFPSVFTGNKIVLAHKGDYPLGDVQQGADNNRIIANNYIVLASGYYIMRLYGNNNRVINNTFVMQDTEGGHCLRIYGSKNIVTENTCICTGNGIQLSTDANHIVKNNIAVVDGAGSTNIVSDNVAP